MDARRIQTNFSQDASNGSRGLSLVSRPNNRLTTENGNSAPRVLNSWKEIARYMNRGVRTVQRWESEFELPVHRPKGKNRSAVLALQEEIDDWLRRTPSQVGGQKTANSLLAIACDLRNLAERVGRLTNSQTRSERKRVLEAVNTIIRALEQLNGSSSQGKSHSIIRRGELTVMPLVVILSVGQDPLLLETRGTVLQSAGYTVVSVRSLKRAIAEFLEGDFDLVLLCHSIPEENRKSFANLIHEHSPRTPIVFVSSAVAQFDHSADLTIENNPIDLVSGIRDLLTKNQKQLNGREGQGPQDQRGMRS